MNGIFGIAKWMAARAGQARPEAKGAAARANEGQGREATEGGGIICIVSPEFVERGVHTGVITWVAWQEWRIEFTVIVITP